MRLATMRVSRSLLREAVLLGAMLGAAFPLPAQYAAYGPPPPVAERLSPAPARGYVWIPGYQRWDGRRYAWEPGRWVRPPRPAAVWLPGHWDRSPRGWFWVQGRWRG